MAAISLLPPFQGCMGGEKGLNPEEWDEIFTVQFSDGPYKRDGEPFKIGVNYLDGEIETSEGHVLHREPITTDEEELRDLASKWFDDRGYLASTYGAEIGDGQIGSWIYTGAPLDPERYEVINPTKEKKGYDYFSLGMYLGTLQEFDTDDDGLIDVWTVSLRKDSLTRKGQLEYKWRGDGIYEVRIEYPSLELKTPESRLKENGIDTEKFKSPW